MVVCNLPEEDPEYSVLITNPPFKYKYQFLEKAFKSGKPFAMILLITCLCTVVGSALFEHYPLSVFSFCKQVPFDHDGTLPMFKDIAWFVDNLFPKHGDFIPFSYIDNIESDDVVVFSDDDDEMYEDGSIVV